MSLCASVLRPRSIRSEDSRPWPSTPASAGVSPANRSGEGVAGDVVQDLGRIPARRAVVCGQGEAGLCRGVSSDRQEQGDDSSANGPGVVVSRETTTPGPFAEESSPCSCRSEDTPRQSPASPCPQTTARRAGMRPRSWTTSPATPSPLLLAGDTPAEAGVLGQGRESSLLIERGRKTDAHRDTAPPAPCPCSCQARGARRPKSAH